jgi:hypothetical protein
VFSHVGVTLRVTGGTQRQGYSVQLVQHQGGVKGKELAVGNTVVHVCFTCCFHFLWINNWSNYKS